MATSKRQLKANRRNAQQSTGPVTTAGKAIACRNATTHGLYACDTIINSPHLKENPEHYDLLVRSLVDELQPRSVLQEHLVHKIANCLWRYRRAINAETAQINDQLESLSRPSPPLRIPDEFGDLVDCPPEDDASRAARLADLSRLRSVPTDSFRTNLTHYEMRLDKQLAGAYRLLRKLQSLDDTGTPPDHHSKTEKTQNEPISPQLPDS